MADFTVKIVDGFSLADPFMVASSHWTSKENVFRHLAPVKPSAVTLKTTSARKGGAGTAEIGRNFRWMRDPFGNRFARYTDGPAMLELWDVPTTEQMSRLAKAIMPDALLGLSVLQNEDYAALASKLPLELYGYVELNWKYTLRGVALADRAEALRNVTEDLKAFIAAFARLPKLIKLPREVSDFLNYPEFGEILALIQDAGAGVIIANSRRTPVPPSRVHGKKIKELDQGVVVGDHLFLDTYRLIRQLVSGETGHKRIPPIIASGGIVDMGAVVDVIAAGAVAVQLCTAFDMWGGVHVLEWFREQLGSLVADSGSHLSRFANVIRDSEDEWNKASMIARDYELQIPRLAEIACADSSALDLLATVLEEEISKPALNTSVDVDISAVFRETPCSCIVTYGNVSSLLIARRFNRTHGIPAIEFESARDFVNQLKEPSFRFDFALITEAAYKYSQQIDAEIPVENKISILAEVGCSIMELVADDRLALDKILQVYHFGGTSAREAIRALEKSRPLPEGGLQEIQAPLLVPLLRSWKTGHSILAKAPLSRLYGLVTPLETKKHWGRIWHCEDKLLLVCSGALVGRDGSGKLRQAMVGYVALERERILSDLKRAAVELQQERFLQHCAILMGAKLPRF